MNRLKCAIVILLLICLLSPANAVNGDRPFTDVRDTDWFYENVQWMTELGYLKGYPDGSFRPGEIITAAEFVSIMARVTGAEPHKAQVNHWAGGAMQAALDRGWYDWDEIPPAVGSFNAPLVRQIAVKIIMNAFAPEARGDYVTESAKMADFAQLDGRYYNAVLAAYATGVVVGDADGNFYPKMPLTRAQACALICRAMQKLDIDARPSEAPSPPEDSEDYVARGGVSENGQLQVIGTQLCNEKGEAVVLRGMSSHGIQWYANFLTRAAIKSTADNGANLLRVAMYTDEGGYISNPEAMRQTLIDAVDTAIALDMYVIIDWHILHDGNPNTHREEAKAFFTQMAERYQDSPAVLYEICNEPNGNVTWEHDVRPYAEEVIGAIRAVDADAVILVGSPTWSQDLQEVAKHPLDGENIMYTCHFYAGTHTAWLRDRISDVLRQGIPVFISEWGTSDASGSGGVYPEETRRWIDFMNANHLSWANWSLCDKAESSAAVKPGAYIADGISRSELSPSGQLVFSHFRD